MKIRINEDVYNIRFVYDGGKYKRHVPNGRALRGRKSTLCIITNFETKEELGRGFVARLKKPIEENGKMIPADDHNIETGRTKALERALNLAFPTPAPMIMKEEDTELAKSNKIIRSAFWEQWRSRKTGSKKQADVINLETSEIKDLPEMEIVRVTE